MLNKRLFALFVLSSLALTAVPAWADEFQDTINVFKKAEESGKFFANAYGYAVFPTIGKGGIGIGGAYGTGRVYEKGRWIGGTSMTQLSVGFQLGGQGFSQIIFFENAAALHKFTQGEFEFSAAAFSKKMIWLKPWPPSWKPTDSCVIEVPPIQRPFS
jgi:hypothetical protein